jgi:hypothetical protein
LADGVVDQLPVLGLGFPVHSPSSSLRSRWNVVWLIPSSTLQRFSHCSVVKRSAPRQTPRPLAWAEDWLRLWRGNTQDRMNFGLRLRVRIGAGPLSFRPPAGVHS